MELPLQEQWARKSRFLTQALIFSGALNIGLLTSFVYLIVRDQKEAVVFELQPAGKEEIKLGHSSNAALLTQFSTMSYAELVALLDNVELVETGYKKRDLALACLVAFHCVDLDQAMQGAPIQKRTLSFQRNEGPEQVDITVYPGLSEDEHRAIAYFIKTERFPFTSQGLFFELKTASKPYDPALLEAFYMTSEYTMFSTLLMRSGVPLPAGYVIELMIQGDWEILKQFTEEQKKVQDLSPDRLKSLLTSYVRCRSLFAAKILLQLDRGFILKKFEDPDLLTLIDLFPQKNDLIETFLKELITSPRSDAIWKKAGEKLCQFANLSSPDPYDHRIILQQFIPQLRNLAVSPPSQTQQQTPAAPRPSKTHIVQSGENLWKIARKYRISIEVLRQANHLESDKIVPGKKLIIPT